MFCAAIKRDSVSLLRFHCCILTTIMISITTVHIQMQNTYAETGGLCCSGTNVLLTSDFGSSTRAERHNSYYADDTIWPHKSTAHLAMFKISVVRDPKIPTTSSTVENSILYAPMAELNYLPARSNCQPSTASFSKSLNSQDHLFRVWRHPHISPISV